VVTVDQEPLDERPESTEFRGIGRRALLNPLMNKEGSGLVPVTIELWVVPVRRC